MSRRFDPYSRSSATMTPAQADQAQATAIGQALQMRGNSYVRERDVVAEEHEAFLARMDRIGRDAPCVRTAWAMIDQHQLTPVPIDGNLNPSGDPITTVDGALAHWRDRPGDSIGITTGKHPTRPFSYLAVAVDQFATWKEWLRSAAKVTEKVPDLGGFADLGGTAEVGPAKESSYHRDTGGFARLIWVPPPLPQMRTWVVDAKGGEFNKLWEANKAGRGGWIWLAVPGDVTVKKDRNIDDGIRLLADGTVIPWNGARTHDKWTLRLESPGHSHDGLAPPKAGGIAPWLLTKLTGKKNR